MEQTLHRANWGIFPNGPRVGEYSPTEKSFTFFAEKLDEPAFFPILMFMTLRLSDISNIKITYWQSSSTRHTYKVFFDDKLSVEGKSLKQVAFLAAKTLKAPYGVILGKLNAIKVHTWNKSRDWYLRNKEAQDRLTDAYDDLGAHRWS